MLKDKLSYSTTPLRSIYVAADVKCYCKMHFRQHMFVSSEVFAEEYLGILFLQDMMLQH